MKDLLFLIPAALVLLTSCKQPAAEESGPRPVKLAEVTALGMVEKTFSGVVSASQFSDLAFKMSGPLVSLTITAGQRVRAGEVIAEIDPQDFKWEYEAKKASLQTAEAQLQRAEKLLARQAISQQEYETTKASCANAQAAFEYARNTLEQTKLRAPFDGFIQQKYVENYQKVQTGQAVVCLINPDKLQVQYTMPETNLQYFSSPYTVQVEFDNHKGHYYRARVKEYVEASPDGSGVPVFLDIIDSDFTPATCKVAVGFSCRVILHIETTAMNQGSVYIPLAAVVASEQNDSKYAFVFNPQIHQVERRQITVSDLMGRDDAIVTAGLKAGEQVVTAGATRLTDGQTVKVLTD